MKDQGRVLTCVYCGQPYPQNTPAWGNKILTDHIKVCEKHPMRQAENDIAKLRSALAGLLGTNDAKELEGSEVPTPQDSEQLIKYINSLVGQKHDYWTCVYAMSMSAVAAFNYVAHRLGVTGFQASCAGMDILRRTRGMKNGFMIIDFHDLLYPQYLNEEHFPGFTALINSHADILSKAAKKMLAENPSAHPEVLSHWRYLAGLKAPRQKNKGSAKTVAQQTKGHKKGK